MKFSELAGEAIIEVRADTSQLKKNLDTAKKNTQKASKDMSDSMSVFASRAKVAMAAVGVAFSAALMSSVRFADQMDKMAVKSGLAFDTVQKLNFASKQLGFSFQLVETLGFRLTRRMGEAAEGSEAVANAFARLNVPIKNADGTFRDVNEVLPDTVNALASMEDKAKRNAIAVKIFDTEFRSLLPLIEAGPGALNRVSEEAERLGLIVSKDVNDSFVLFGDLLSNATQQLQTGFMNALGPAIAGFNQFMVAISGTELQQVNAELNSLTTELERLKKVRDEFAQNVKDERFFGLFVDSDTATVEKYNTMIDEVTKKIEDFKKKRDEISKPAPTEAASAASSSGPVAARSLSFQKTDLAEQLRMGTISLEAYRQKLAEINAMASLGPEALTQALQDGKLAVRDFERIYEQSMNKVADKSTDTASQFTKSFQDAFSQLGGILGGNDPILGAILGPILGAVGSKAGSFFTEQFGFKAMGGPVSMSKPYMVGEKGPELFIPQQAGTIVPNGAGGQGMVINQNINLMPDVGERFKEQLSMAMPVIRQAAVDANNEFNARRGRGGIR